jgi:hypothetical protein
MIIGNLLITIDKSHKHTNNFIATFNSTFKDQYYLIYYKHAFYSN